VAELASYDVVVPTVGRPSLAALLAGLAAGAGPPPARVLLVDDRPAAERDARPLLTCQAGGDGPGQAVLESLPGGLEGRVQVLASGGAGPAAARNTGWRAATSAWVAFLDDDVVPEPGWRVMLAADLEAAPPDLAGSQGRVRVPLPKGRRPTDWERNVLGLERARWATADLAYRRAALAAAGGFDERFRRAYREDTDLGLRLTGAGWRIEHGRRAVTHPVRPAGACASLRAQAGNADDVLLAMLHGRGWRAAGGVPPGRRGRHLAVTAAAVAGLAGLALGERRLAAPGLACWAAGTAELAWARIAPGPRTPRETATMLATSALLPAAATWHWAAGLVRHRRVVLARLLGPRATLIRVPAGPPATAGAPHSPPRVAPATGRPSGGPAVVAGGQTVRGAAT
jgi:Glycosyl transferase family 2